MSDPPRPLPPAEEQSREDGLRHRGCRLPRREPRRAARLRRMGGRRLRHCGSGRRADGEARRLAREGRHHRPGLLRARPARRRGRRLPSGRRHQPLEARRPRQTKVNVEGTRNVVAAALRSKARRLVHTSSIAAYGFQPSRITEEMRSTALDSSINYFRSKRLAELEVQRGNRAGPRRGDPEPLQHPRTSRPLRLVALLQADRPGEATGSSTRTSLVLPRAGGGRSPHRRLRTGPLRPSLPAGRRRCDLPRAGAADRQAAGAAHTEPRDTGVPLQAGGTPLALGLLPDAPGAGSHPREGHPPLLRAAVQLGRRPSGSSATGAFPSRRCSRTVTAGCSRRGC